MWKSADEATLSCGFGDLAPSRSTARLPNPIHFGVEAPGTLPADAERLPGHYLVGFYDDDRLIGIEGGALPPPGEILR
nr:hypothetical protein [uncultured bacterium]